MGCFNYDFGVANPESGEFRWVTGMVDSGAAHSMIPKSLLTEIHLVPTREARFSTADGTIRTYGIGEARLKIDDQERTCQVIFGPEDKYLLGATSLQNFEVIPDTSNHRLIPVEKLTI